MAGPESRSYPLLRLRDSPRIVEVEQDNKMTPGNLGIVFGPSLLRPRPTEATVSLSSLVDYPHQARVVETLITHYSLVFEEEPEGVPGGQVSVWEPRAVCSRQVLWGRQSPLPRACGKRRGGLAQTGAEGVRAQWGGPARTELRSWLPWPSSAPHGCLCPPPAHLPLRLASGSPSLQLRVPCCPSPWDESLILVWVSPCSREAGGGGSQPG